MLIIRKTIQYIAEGLKTHRKLKFQNWPGSVLIKNEMLEFPALLEHARRRLEHARRRLEHARRRLEHARKRLEHARRRLEHARRRLDHARKLQLIMKYNDFVVAAHCEI